MNIEQMTDEQINACWDDPMPSGCGKSRYDIADAILAARDAQWNALIAGPAVEAVAWPAELSSISRTQPVRFNVIYRDDGEPVIDDDDFKFDALIKVHGDFDEGEKEKYVTEVCRRLNGVASLPAPQVAQAEQLYEAIKDVLEHHRLTHTMEDEDSGFPLVDMLCPPDSKDIALGKDEVVFICDAIFNEVLCKTPAAPSPDGKAEQAEAPSDEREEIEAVIACLGDDAAQLRDENPEDERADNMDRAATLLERLIATQSTTSAAGEQS